MSVDADLRRQGAGQREGHGDQRALGGGIGHRRADADDAGDGRGVDHRARGLAGLEQGAGGADHLERADDIDLVQMQEVLGRDRVEVGVVGGELGGPGVVEQGVDAAEALGGGGHRPAVGVVGDVGLGQHGLGAPGLDQGRGLFGLVGAAGVVDHHRGGPAAGGLLGDGPSQAGRGAGDHHHLAVEVLAAMRRLLPLSRWPRP